MENKRHGMGLFISVHKAAIKAAYRPFKMKQNTVNESWEKRKKSQDRQEHEEGFNGLFSWWQRNFRSKLINEYINWNVIIIYTKRQSALPSSLFYVSNIYFCQFQLALHCPEMCPRPIYFLNVLATPVSHIFYQCN